MKITGHLVSARLAELRPEKIGDAKCDLAVLTLQVRLVAPWTDKRQPWSADLLSLCEGPNAAGEEVEIHLSYEAEVEDAGEVTAQSAPAPAAPEPFADEDPEAVVAVPPPRSW